MWLQVQRLLLVLLMVSSSAAQTFQYSRGWTNGKRSPPLSQASCQLQRIRAVLQGASLPPSYLLCDLYRIPDEDARPADPDKIAARLGIADGGET